MIMDAGKFVVELLIYIFDNSDECTILNNSKGDIMKNKYRLFVICIMFLTLAFAQDGYTAAELSEEEYNLLVDSAFYFYGEHSPNDSRWILFPDHEEEASQFPLIRTEQDGTPIYELCVFADVEDIAWSPKSDWFAFIDYDLLYNGGDQFIYLVNVFTEEYYGIRLHDFIEQTDIGKRNHLLVLNMGWLPSNDGVVFSIEADYLGTSGDDMIDQHRIEDLGDLFNLYDPLHAGYYVIQLTE